MRVFIAAMCVSLIPAIAGDYAVVQQQTTIIQPVVVPYIWHVNPVSEVFRTYGGMQKQQSAASVAVKPLQSSPTAWMETLRSKCAACHTEGVRVEGNLILFDKSKDLLPHLPYDEMRKWISSKDPGTVMPPSGPLGDTERQSIVSWIEKKGELK